jgi:hypothetical protein
MSEETGHRLVWEEHVLELNKAKTFTPSKLDESAMETEGGVMEHQNFWKNHAVWSAGGHEKFVKQEAKTGIEHENDAHGTWMRQYENGKMVKMTYTSGGRIDHYDPQTTNLLTEKDRMAKHDSGPRHEGALAKLFDATDPRDQIDIHSVQAGRR